MKDFLDGERRLLLALLLWVVLLNVPYGHYALYPFKLFGVWVHETCHGLAALVLGGEIEWLKIHSNTSGRAMTRRPDTRLAQAFVASAGYLGTAILGSVLLALRRTPRIGRFGTAALGAVMLLSVLLWVRNPFGMFAVAALGGLLVAAGLKLSEDAAQFLFAFLAASTSLNAFSDIRELFGSGTRYVGSEVVSRTDAHTVAEALFLPSWFWASLWLLLSAILMVLGLRLGARSKKVSTER